MPHRDQEPPYSTDDVMREVLATQEQVTETRGEALQADTVAAAVKDGLMQAVADPQFWVAAQTAMQQHATREAGSFVLGGVKAMLSRIFWFSLAGVIIYNAGGWTALSLWFKGSHP